MKRRIEVTNTDGNPIYLNPDHMVWVRPIRGKATGPAKVLMVAGEAFEVRETADEVLMRIDMADRGSPQGEGPPPDSA